MDVEEHHFAFSSLTLESPAAMKDETEEDDETQRSSLDDGVSKNHKKKKKGIGFKGDKAKRAVIGAGGRILFYPTLLYNLLRFKLQSQFRWWDQIDEVSFIFLFNVFI